MSADSLLGQTLDEYRLVAVLGRGGMARVYRGLDLRLERLAAIKVIDTQYRADPEYVARFEREARIAACWTTSGRKAVMEGSSWRTGPFVSAIAS